MEQKTEALILRAAREGEADRLLTLLCSDLGKLHVRARGVDKPSGKWAGRVFPFAHIQCILVFRTSNAHRGVLTQCDLLEDFREIRSSLEKIGAASGVCEWLEGLLPERTSPGPLWDLALGTLRALIQARNPAPVVLGFRLNMLIQQGILPELRGCIRCGRPYSGKQAVRFCGEAGGIVCRGCLRKREHFVQMPAEAMAFLSNVSTSRPEEWPHLEIGRSALETVSDALALQVRFHLDWEPKSDDWISGKQTADVSGNQ